MNDLQRIKPIFEQALDRQGQDRCAYLDEVCGKEPELRRKVETLLKAHEQAQGFLESPVLAAEISAGESPLTEGPGTAIGRYKLLEKIGEGGMAVVYMAEQTEPIRRKVALKIIKLGMDTRQVIARFEVERQALALMDHPSIAKVLDAGATETGRPYFVMELVQGVSITEYCDKNSLSTKDRLALFLEICHAVQHAHQKGIIHRDIKPSNVMVTHHDGKPVPKVIDFGIAKATNQKLTEKTLFTRYAHLIGTPAYMSPEQAELSDLDIDTRSDIYSLGVLLYELLTGTTPFSEEELRKAGYVEMQRVIREQEPAKPSTRLSTLGGTLTDIAKCRNSTPDLLRKAIRGDLDWIAMKSLEKDRTRRYETASSLAEDIRRHLQHEPVLARGPGAAYRLQKYFRRHRSRILVALGFGALIAMVLVALSIWNRDRRQLAEAEGFRHRGILSQAREQYARGDRAAALQTLAPIFHSRHVGPEARLLQAGIFVEDRQPEEAMTILTSLLQDSRAVAGAAHSLLARLLWEGEPPDAKKLQEIEEHRRQAEALLPETAEAYFLRAMTALTIKEQLAALDRALQLDSNHYESRRLRAFTYYASRRYEDMADDAFAMTILRPRDPLSHSLRAVALRELGRYEKALGEYDEALALVPPRDPQYLDLSVQRAETILRMGDPQRVVAEARACLKRWPDKAVFQYHLFSALTALGDYANGNAVFQQITHSGLEARSPLEDWCAKYVFDTLAAGRSWYPAGRAPMGAAFLPLVEAEENYRNLSAKAGRLVVDGFTANWSPDGKRLAFSLGVHGYSGVALYDPATKETDLLIVPGKDPRWSPDGRHIAFVRDCQFLRLPEFATAERKSQARPTADEEVWVMKSDGTEPRRLGRGNWPSWSSDSRSIYYHSRVDKVFYSISLTGPEAEPQRIMACPSSFPALSPEGRRVAYVEGGALKVKDLATQASLAEWKLPFTAWGGVAWSPSGEELCLGGNSGTGLWLFRFDRSEPIRILDGLISAGSWSAGGTKVLLTLAAPYFEIWGADVNPKVSALKSLAPAQTVNEHFQEMVALWTRRIEADPADASSYLRRAGYYQSLREQAKARADTWRYWAALHPGLPPGLLLRGPWSVMETFNGPFDYQLVVFLERQEDGLQLLRIACGQKGRCEMKSFEMPMVVTSLLGLCLLSGLDAPPARADFAFGHPVNLGPTVNSTADDFWPIVSSDGLEVYFGSTRPGGHGDWDIWTSKRASVEDPWGPPSNLAQLNSAGWDCVGSISSDGLTLYFESQTGKWADLYTSTRPSTDAPWGPRINMGPVLNRTDGGGGPGWGHEGGPIIAADDLELFFYSNRPGTIGLSDIFVSTRATPTNPWGPPVNLGPAVNSSRDDFTVAISPDGLILFIVPINRSGGYGNYDTWMIRRACKGAAWSEPLNLGPSFNTAGYETLTSISPDGRCAYFSAPRPGGYGSSDLWMAPIVPLVDFNADGIVDANDEALLTAHLDQSDLQYDIGPFPWGDGKVDANDVEVLKQYVGQEVYDPTLIAHWKLDEAEGAVAKDSAGTNHGNLYGNLLWQPTGGKIGGALQFLGDLCLVSTPFICDPAAGPFSVFAWVQGGAPDQVILAQANGACWLKAADLQEMLKTADLQGALMTELKAARGAPLFSATVITDGAWHRVGLVWDGSNRILYVDAIEVARDKPGAVTGSTGSLTIGGPAAPGQGGFWTGLIDDVRIYNRAADP